MSRTVAIIQARLGSTRFPRKALALVDGDCVMEHVLRRAESIKGVDRVVLAVPHADYETFDDIWTDRCWCAVGLDERDVLGRYARCASELGAETVVRLTGDCPLLNPRIAEQVLALYHSDPHVEYASNIAPGYVDGEDVEVFNVSALQWAHRAATTPYDREHVTPWLRRNVKIATLQPFEDRSAIKTSIDTVEDLERVRAMLVPA